MCSVHGDFASFAAQGVELPATTGPEYVKAFDRIRARYFKKYERAFLEELQRETDEVVKDMRRAANIQATIGMAIGAAKKHAKGIKKPYADLYTEIFPDIAGRTYDSIIKASKGQSNTKASEAELVDIWTQAALTFIEEEGGSLITPVILFTHEEVERVVRGLVKTAAAEGQTIDWVATSLEEKFGTINSTRAYRISRTEVLRASAKASREGALATGFDLTKEWRTALTARITPRHTDPVLYPGLHGQKRDMDKMFSVGGHEAMYPLDPMLPPGESIQCRCEALYYRKK